jgi:hypothetical protein
VRISLRVIEKTFEFGESVVAQEVLNFFGAGVHVVRRQRCFTR